MFRNFRRGTLSLPLALLFGAAMTDATDLYEHQATRDEAGTKDVGAAMIILSEGESPNQSPDTSCGFHEPHRSRIHAIAKPGRTGTIIEYVTKMGIALAARDRRPPHTEAHIAYFDDIIFRISVAGRRLGSSRSNLRRTAGERILIRLFEKTANPVSDSS